MDWLYIFQSLKNSPYSKYLFFKSHIKFVVLKHFNELPLWGIFCCSMQTLQNSHRLQQTCLFMIFSLRAYTIWRKGGRAHTHSTLHTGPLQAVKFELQVFGFCDLQWKPLIRIRRADTFSWILAVNDQWPIDWTPLIETCKWVQAKKVCELVFIHQHICCVGHAVCLIKTKITFSSVNMFTCQTCCFKMCI